MNDLSLEDVNTQEQPDDGLVEVEWPIIWVDEEDGKPNFEVVGVNGVNFQIKRNTEVCVPPAVIGVLRNAVGTIYVKKEGDDGKVRSTPQEKMLVPWRQVGTGKMRVTPERAKRGY